MNKRPKIVFSDFDGTLTKQGNFSPVFFDVLNLVKEKNIKFVIVTGRALSWSHFLMTHFPIDACITEGGGMLSVGRKKGFVDHCLVDQSELQRLLEITQSLLNKFPNLQLSEDSLCRITDRAIDLNVLEETSLIQAVSEFFDKGEVNYSCSNVHLNYWTGNFTKASAIKYYLENFSNDHPDDCLFFGDSLNDELVFKMIKNSVGVSNIKSVLDKLKVKPAVILEGPENAEILGVMNYLKKNV